MRRILILSLIMLLFLPLSARKVGKVSLPETLTIDKEELLLNGAGLRKKLVIQVYACGLYLTEKLNSSEAILADSSAIAVRMHFIYKEVDNQKLIEAWNAGFKKTNADITFPREVKQFNSFFSETAQKGDVYDIVYLPDKGIEVIKNSKTVGRIESKNFRRAVFSIWLSEKTDLPKLRKQLLGN